MLQEIEKIAKLHCVIKLFISKYSSQIGVSVGQNEMPKGLYLQAFAVSLDSALEPFRAHLVQLERKYIENPNLPLSYVLTEVKQFETFFYFLLHFLSELETQALHGCAILIHLHKYDIHADEHVMQAIKTIRKGVYAVFLRQLSQWLIYGRLDDMHEEFFIVHIDENKSKNNQHLDAGTVLSTATISDSVNTDLWQYEIVYDLLPSNFPPSWAEKVLFIGQTVQMLRDDPRKTTKKMSIWNDEDDEYSMEIGSLWNKKEHVYFNKIQHLYDSDSTDIGAYERVVNEIKAYVTERLSEIAFNQADLIKHLRLIKDYYLLGRGEFFLEFIIQTESITAKRDEINDHIARDLNQAFQTALNRTSNDLEQITMHLPLDEFADFPSDFDDDPKLFLHLIRLKFNVKWPLHLFFSPVILERYNQLFRFLLQIRKTQNDLHRVWRLHREEKLAGNSKMSQLRNQMLFLINNLQYYLQVDVLEGQFSILINAVQNSKDFEYIQRAHSIFQANVMSLCFLLNSNTNEMNTTKAKSITHENPVVVILNKIMKTIRLFCSVNESCERTITDLTNDELQLLELNDKL